MFLNLLIRISFTSSNQQKSIGSSCILLCIFNFISFVKITKKRMISGETYFWQLFLVFPLFIFCIPQATLFYKLHCGQKLLQFPIFALFTEKNCVKSISFFVHKFSWKYLTITLEIVFQTVHDKFSFANENISVYGKNKCVLLLPFSRKNWLPSARKWYLVCHFFHDFKGSENEFLFFDDCTNPDARMDYFKKFHFGGFSFTNFCVCFVYIKIGRAFWGFQRNLFCLCFENWVIVGRLRASTFLIF